MNIFYVHSDPIIAAQSLVDKHCIKMILESAQLLSTAHRVIDGKMYLDKTKTGRQVKRWKLDDERETVLYAATHISHPSTVWCRANFDNYNWLYKHFAALLNEYTYRYGKVHKCASMALTLRFTPQRIPLGNLTPVTPAMPDEYKVAGDSVASYRNYYRSGKSHLHKWTNREAPEWINENVS